MQNNFSPRIHSNTNSQVYEQWIGVAPTAAHPGKQYPTERTRQIIEQLIQQGYHISKQQIQNGLLHIVRNTGLRGRWQTIQQHPTVICDTGHNVGGITYVAKQLKEQECETLRIVFGMVSDKDVNTVLELMPKNAVYYFCQASVKRAMPHNELKKLGKMHGLVGNSYKTVENAYKKAIKQSNAKDVIFVGGSTFVVADFLSYREKNMLL